MTASPERISLLRWVTFGALAALFVSDYMFDSWAKPVPPMAYGILLAVALGIDLPSLRALFLRFLESFVDRKQ